MQPRSQKQKEIMNYIFFSQANELLRVHPGSIAFIASEGNYSRLTLVDKSEILFSFNLQHCQSLLEEQLGTDAQRFMRVGRSLVVNGDYIFRIRPMHKELTLAAPDMSWKQHLKASKEALCSLKSDMENEMKQP